MKLTHTLLKMIKSPLHPSEEWEKGALNIKEGGKKMEETVMNAAAPAEESAPAPAKEEKAPAAEEVAAEAEAPKAEAPEAKPVDSAREFYGRWFGNLEQEAGRLGEKYPGLDFREEMKNTEFARLVSPRVGLNVETAYKICHFDEIMEKKMESAGRAAKEAAANTIRAGAGRPAENGTSGRAAGTDAQRYSGMTREQQDEFKRRILLAAARGEKVYPA